MTGIFVGASEGRIDDVAHISARMYKVVILATAFADKAREVTVAIYIFAHLFPQPMECPKTIKKLLKGHNLFVKTGNYGTDPVKLMALR